jgi:hypothetical protein
MDRIKALITRLQEQYDQQAEAGQMKMTAQLLLAELQQADIRKNLKPDAASRVAVVMPSAAAHVQATAVTAPPAQPVPVEKKESAIKKESLPKELNEAMATHTESLNDKLKEDKTEIAEVLTETPIKDLRKAISLNDRFIFISELFRNDENLYDNAIKSLNAFNIYPEALFWMERELIAKLDWDSANETVRHFMSLVRRRYL